MEGLTFLKQYYEDRMDAIKKIDKEEDLTSSQHTPQRYLITKKSTVNQSY